MKALLCKTLDGPGALTIEDIIEPSPGPGQVAIAVGAVSLNFFDALMTRGKYQFKPPLPFSPGGEVAGTVKSLGEGVDGLTTGQRVVATTGWNACREVIVVPAHSVFAIPSGVSDDAAASLPIAYGTALHALTDRGRLKRGETILVLGATGGTGLAAVEIALKLGATVIAAGSSDEKLKICSERGAQHLLNLTGVDLRAAMKEMTGGKGVDVVYDCLGGPYAEPAIRSLAWEGRYLVIGFAAGGIPQIALNLVLLKGSEIVGVFWGSHVEKQPAAFRAQMEQLLAWCSEGGVRPHIDRVVDLDHAADAIHAMERREIKGKAVVRL